MEYLNEKHVYTYFYMHRTPGSSGTITIKCKDLRVLQLDIPGMEQCLNIAQSIEVFYSNTLTKAKDQYILP